MIELQSINQLYGSSQILWDLSLKLSSGSCTCLMGRNGVGKTTLLKCLMGLLAIESGEIIIDGRNVTKEKTELRPKLGVGYVPQGRDIFPQLTVEENLKVALAGRSDKSKRIPSFIFDLFPVWFN